MSVQSDAAKRHIESLFQQAYPNNPEMWIGEHPFAKLDMKRGWRFDYADFAHRCAIEIDGGTFQAKRTGHASGTGLRAWREKNNAAVAAGWRVWHYAPEEIIKAGRKAVKNALLNVVSSVYRNANTSFIYVLGNGMFTSIAQCVTLPDEPILKCLPWLEKREEQTKL